MLWLLTRLIVWPAQVAATLTVVSARATALGARSGWRTARFIGLRRLGLVGAGVVAGLLLAPRSGREMRERLRPRTDEHGNRVWAPFGEVPVVRIDRTPETERVGGESTGRHPVHVPIRGDVDAHIEQAPTGEVEEPDQADTGGRGTSG